MPHESDKDCVRTDSRDQTYARRRNAADRGIPTLQALTVQLRRLWDMAPSSIRTCDLRSARAGSRLRRFWSGKHETFHQLQKASGDGDDATAFALNRKTD